MFSACSQEKMGQKQSSSTQVEETTSVTETETTTIKKIDKNILYWNLINAPKSYDPAAVKDLTSANIINQTYEGLVRDQDGTILPAIAESWEYSEANQEDGSLTLTFHLRKSKWSDGSDLVADDFIYAWQRSMNLQIQSPFAWLWKYTNIKGASQAIYGEIRTEDVAIRAVDDYTIEMDLERKSDYLLSILTLPPFMPVKQKEELEISEVSNGPFQMALGGSNEYLVLLKNKEYWNVDNVQLEQINIQFSDDNSKLFEDFENGVLQVIDYIPNDKLMRLAAEDDQFRIFSQLGANYAVFNLGKERMRDEHLRRALALSVDRAILEQSLFLGQKSATTLLPKSFTDYRGKEYNQVIDDDIFTFNPETINLAKSEFAESDFEASKDTEKIKIAYNNYEQKLIAEVLQKSYKKNLGIEALVVAYTDNDWDILLRHNRFAFSCPAAILEYFESNNDDNKADYRNPEFDQLIKTASTSDWQEHDQALTKAYNKLVAEMIFIPLYYDQDYILVSNRVTRWSRSLYGLLDFSEAELESLE